MKAKAFFFDAHGVIYYRPSEGGYLKSFLESQDFNGDIKAAKASTAHLRDQAFRGKIGLDEYRVELLKGCGFNDPDVIDAGISALKKDQANIALYEGVIETITTLKNQDFKVGIITDAAVAKMRKLEWIRSCGLKIAWDAYANSMDLGTRKPDPLMYQTALQQARISHHYSVFVGHASHELTGARSMGMTTVAFHPDPDAEADFFIESLQDLFTLPLF